jgi:hypothetical protein
MITNKIEGIKTWFETQTFTHITKKVFHPSAEEIVDFKAGLMILNYDEMDFETLTFSQNDEISF